MDRVGCKQSIGGQNDRLATSGRFFPLILSGQQSSRDRDSSTLWIGTRRAENIEVIVSTHHEVCSFELSGFMQVTVFARLSGIVVTE